MAASPSLLDRLGIAHPVAQAGMGGGVAGPALAGAVAAAGGLGTLGLTLDGESLRLGLGEARERAPGRPLSVNLLLPVLRREHVEVCLRERVPIVSLFYGFDRELVTTLRGAGVTVLHQVGSVAGAERALAEGASGLIAQGRGAGGHVLEDLPLAALLPPLRRLAGDRPLLAGGGVYDAASAAAAATLGADGVWVGTRFLLTPESGAHEAYKERLLAANHTLLTQLFGLGWAAPHRVVPNAATERWCAQDARGPAWARRVGAAAERLARHLPRRGAERLVARQRLGVPLYSPLPVLRGMDPALLEVTPLYAGTCVEHLSRLEPAAGLVTELSRGFHQGAH